jgi:DNA-directed RNA polymerase subunit RPC12/RpoP
MQMSASNCAHCGKDVAQRQKKTYNRVQGKIRRSTKTPAQLLKAYVDVDVTPERSDYMCNDCLQPLQSVDAGHLKVKESLDKFLTRTKKSRSLAFPTPTSPFSTPARKSARRGLVCSTPHSTPVSRAAQKARSASKAAKHYKVYHFTEI